jgi:hypothetical protein
MNLRCSLDIVLPESFTTADLHSTASNPNELITSRSALTWLDAIRELTSHLGMSPQP